MEERTIYEERTESCMGFFLKKKKREKESQALKIKGGMFQSSRRKPYFSKSYWFPARPVQLLSQLLEPLAVAFLPPQQTASFAHQ